VPELEGERRGVVPVDLVTWDRAEKVSKAASENTLKFEM